DLTAPGQRYTAAQFQAYANKAIADIRARNKVPIITGGTGLYIDGIIFDYAYPAEATSEIRATFENMTTEQLHDYCIQHNLELPINDKNKRHLIRTALQGDTPNRRRQVLLSNTYVFGVATDKEQLRTRIRIRAEQMFENEVVEEARRLGNKYGWESEVMTGNIYPLMRQYLSGEVTEAEAIEAFIVRDWQLAKRQMTWFRRNPYIAWGSKEDISQRVAQLFNSE
ncbi:tRNA (adenosine(37)-N6)-dimethylallyltransferase MiaA, partial [Candidatus Saccharibacteria bacterium]|nr:tRNA (adenosine(37)-N6)-dimethylallyltransferase MiaA [Candidatus Saccharibacteria bacterium]